MSTIHSTPDWDETTCGLSLWGDFNPGDIAIGESDDPARHPAHYQCPQCYTPETIDQRTLLYAAADAMRIPWEKQQKALASMLMARRVGDNERP